MTHADRYEASTKAKQEKKQNPKQNIKLKFKYTTTPEIESHAGH